MADDRPKFRTIDGGGEGTPPPPPAPPTTAPLGRWAKEYADMASDLIAGMHSKRAGLTSDGAALIIAAAQVNATLAVAAATLESTMYDVTISPPPTP